MSALDELDIYVPLAVVDIVHSLEAENERLRADRDDVRAELTNLQVAFNDWKVTHSTVRLEVEIERLRADAARLDYIEKHARYDPKMDGNHAWWPTTFEHVLRGPTLRAAIDAQMRGESEA